MNNKNLVGNYNEYLSRFEDGETDIVFSGEWSILKALKLNNSQGIFYVWDMLYDNSSSILFKIDAAQDSVHIDQAYELDISPSKIAERFCISDVSSAIKWWNLCYYRNQDGNVLYDVFYDKFFLANDSDKTMGDFHEMLKQCTSLLPDDIANNKIYVLGELGTFNPFIYELQKLNCLVIPLFAEQLSESEELDGQLLQLKKELVVPYCNGETYKIYGLSSDGTIEVQAECNHPYVISLPCDNLDLNAIVLGGNTLKQILPNGEVRRDYKCCGQEYMYLEQTLYADIFGNTFIKSINSGMNPEDKVKMPCLNIFSLNK